MFSRFNRRTEGRLSLAVLLAIAAMPVHALEPATPLSRFARQAWTMESGLPQNTVPVLFQSRSGFLWAGTELGLARFDGTSFRVFDHAASPAFPDAEIRCLQDAQDGSLWIGTSDGLVRLLNGMTTRMSTQDGLPGNSIRGLAETADGTLWAWTEAGLAHFDGKRFLPRPASGFRPESINSIAAGQNSTLWIGSAQGAFSLSGQSQPKRSTTQLPALVKAVASSEVLIANTEGVFLARDSAALLLVLPKASLPAGGVASLARLAGGAIALASQSEIVLAQGSGSRVRILGRYAVAKELPGSRIESLYADREGALWIGTNHGLARIAVSGGETKLERMPSTDPLATNAILSVLEDREGDLWAGTEAAGLHILRDSRFRLLGASDGLTSDATTAVVEGSHHSLWIGTRDSGLNHLSFAPDGAVAVTSLTTKEGLLSNVILSLAADPAGDLWVGTPDGLNRIARKRITSYTSADGLPDDFIRSLLVAPDSSLWIGTRRGLTHWHQGHSETYTHANGLGNDLVGALAFDRDGSLWIATLNGLSRFQSGHIENFTTADGLSSNVITALETTTDGQLWIGTHSDGINLWNGRQFLPVHSAAAASSALPKGIHAILDDREHLWLATDYGLTRIDRPYALDCAQYAKCNQSSAAISNFTTADGLRSRETSSNSHPTAARASNGSLWFTTPRGVILVDPIHFPPSPPPPPVAIERFAVDDRDMQSDMQSANNPARITAGALRLQFDYAGLSFASPQKLRYQYMLEGFDRTWIDAGSRRTAYYTNIPPAEYRFRVRAAFSDAAFAETTPTSRNPGQSSQSLASYAPLEAVLSFELEPHFYQTWWFRALLILLLAALIAYIFRRRVLRVEREFRAVMRERNRIAREIHDTLAQGYVGISLQLEILGQLLQLNRTDAAQKHLTLTQGMVREGLDDARQSIWALRSQDATEQTLPIRLSRLVEQAADSDLASEFKVHGAVRPLSPEAEQEILRIAQEAVHNVKKHARASRLNVRLDYQEQTLSLIVADNGQGFLSGAKFPAITGEGHYGLTGMQERAALIQAKVEILSQPGSGTTVRLHVSAPGAHERKSQ